MKNKFLLFLTFIFIVQCGYKVVNHNELNQYYIESFKLEGENRINRILKKNILFYSKNTNKNIFNLKIKTKKNKIVLEKNIKNEIIKYQVSIDTSLEFYNLKSGKTSIETFSEVGDLIVASKNIDTRNNEKKLIENLIKEMSENIIKKMRSL
tara:strand:- start:238 stop:693 length:456 start_codon:yes stop_codon:yes gene_type:complete